MPNPFIEKLSTLSTAETVAIIFAKIKCKLNVLIYHCYFINYVRSTLYFLILLLSSQTGDSDLLLGAL